MSTLLDVTHLYRVSYTTTPTHLIFKIRGPGLENYGRPKLFKDDSKPHSFTVELEEKMIARITVPKALEDGFEGWGVGNGRVEVRFRK